MKHLKLFENFDWDEEDFDDEEFEQIEDKYIIFGSGDNDNNYIGYIVFDDYYNEYRVKLLDSERTYGLYVIKNVFPDRMVHTASTNGSTSTNNNSLSYLKTIMKYPNAITANIPSVLNDILKHPDKYVSSNVNESFDWDDEDFDIQEENEDDFTYIKWDGNMSDIYIYIEGDNILYGDYELNDSEKKDLIPLTNDDIETMINKDYLVYVLNIELRGGLERIKYSELIKKYPQFKL